MTCEELKIRRLTNQYLIKKGEKQTVIRDLCGVQAQFMANAIHALKIRCHDFDEATVADGLVKNWSIRGTVHVFAESDLALFKHCENGKSYLSNEWRGISCWQRPDGSLTWNGDSTCIQKYILHPERQRYFSHLILEAVSEKPRTRDELKQLCAQNGMTLTEASVMFESWGGGIRDLCERGFMNYVVAEKKAYCIAPPFDPIPEDAANLEIARRYFTNIAPATIKDAAYYFHATHAQVRDWLNKLPVTTLECEGKTYYYIENGKAYNEPIPPCLFLAGFDQLMLGYEKKESIFLPSEHIRGIFNLAGIVMPAVLLDGKVIGKWRKKNRKLEITCFEPLSMEKKKVISDAADKLWNGELSSLVFGE